MGRALAVVAAVSAMFSVAGCARFDQLPYEGSGPAILRPLPQGASSSPRQHRLVYVPVYSSIYWGFDRQLIDLAATLSIRNVSAEHPIVIHALEYYDSEGHQVRQYVEEPSRLDAMATADFVIQRKDKTGGTGANFLIEWSSEVEVDEPVIEAVMIGQHGNAGISFTSSGRTLTKASAALRPGR